MRAGHPVYASLGTTVFEHMSGLSRELGAINLGQGFPDGDEPAELLEAAARAICDKSNQYPPSSGLPDLRAAVAGFYARRQGLTLDPAQVIVTSGATEALAACIFALVEPGDEVILFNPAYDAYAPLVRRAGGVPVFVALDLPSGTYGRAAIKAALSPRTRAIVVNDPLNPTGTVASEDELLMLAKVCIAHDLVAICDEVWEEVRFDGNPHRSLLSVPGMESRAVKIGSAGKVFGLTGWKVGWLCGSVALAGLITRAHQFLTFTTPPALQWAVAEGLALPDAWYDARTAAWASQRRRLREGLERAGFVVADNAATWFLCADLAASGVALTDTAFCERAVREAGVAAIPVSALIESDAPERGLVRFCFAKPEDQLDEATRRLARFRGSLG